MSTPARAPRRVLRPSSPECPPILVPLGSRMQQWSGHPLTAVDWHGARLGRDPAPFQGSFKQGSAVSGGKLLAPGRMRRQLLASMRPPLLAEENQVGVCDAPHDLPASMRPPLLAEENQLMRPVSTRIQRCFNEASAVSGGKRTMYMMQAMQNDSFNEASAVSGGKQGDD